jgi:hypothetical protein
VVAGLAGADTWRSAGWEHAHGPKVLPDAEAVEVIAALRTALG